MGIGAVKPSFRCQLIAAHTYSLHLREPRAAQLQRHERTGIVETDDRDGRSGVATPWCRSIQRLLCLEPCGVQRECERGSQRQEQKAPAASELEGRSADGSLLRGQPGSYVPTRKPARAPGDVGDCRFERIGKSPWDVQSIDGPPGASRQVGTAKPVAFAACRAYTTKGARATMRPRNEVSVSARGSRPAGSASCARSRRHCPSAGDPAARPCSGPRVH